MTSDSGSAEDWEEIFSPGGSKIASSASGVSAKAAAAAIGVTLRSDGSSSAAGHKQKDGGSDGEGTETGKKEPGMSTPPSSPSSAATAQTQAPASPAAQLILSPERSY